MVLLALVLVVLMIFAAFSVDIGTAYAQRRQNQGSVDTAAVAGGVYFLYKGSDFEAMVKEVKNRVDQDMGTKVSAADWASCTDPGHLTNLSTASGYAPIEGNPCISFGRDPNTNTLQMRVRLPDVSSATSFSGIIGIDKLKTHAVAEVNVGSPLGGAFPAYVLSGTPAGGVVCVLMGTHIQPCDEPSNGQFGQFLPKYYSSQPICQQTGNGTADGGYYSNAPAMALGLDHLLSRDLDYPDPSNDRLNGDGNCTVLGPNSVENTQGSSAQVVTRGLLGGETGNRGPAYTGRLVGGPYSAGGGGTNPATMLDLDIDNAPLWAFLLDRSQLQSANAPLECQVAADAPIKRDVAATLSLETAAGLLINGAPAYKTPEALIGACLFKWKPEYGPIFTGDIAKSQRIVSVPRYWETDEHPSAPYHIRDFVPTFLTGEFRKATGNLSKDFVANSPEYTHWAGDPIVQGSGGVYNKWNGNGNLDSLIEGVAGLYVPCGSVPESVCRPTGDPGDNAFGGEVHGVTLAG